MDRERFETFVLNFGPKPPSVEAEAGVENEPAKPAEAAALQEGRG